jgi:hypothetical protein
MATSTEPPPATSTLHGRGHRARAPVAAGAQASPGAGDRAHPPGRDVDGPERVVAGVRHVERGAVCGERDTLRPVEAGDVGRPVRDHGECFTRKWRVCAFPVLRMYVARSHSAPHVVGDPEAATIRREPADEHPMAAGVRHGERSATRCVGDAHRHRARISQRRRPGVGGRVCVSPRQRSGSELARRLRATEQRGDQVGELRRPPLARVLEGDVPGRIDQSERRPPARRPRAPQPELPVVHHRVLHPQPFRRVPDTRRNPLGDELPAVHADYRDPVGELSLQGAQLGRDVLTVDAPVGPEVDEHHAPAERSQRRLTRASLPTTRVHPLEPRRELGRAHGTSISERRCGR